jgi:CO/xanthine dehydrogenase Mo-binding subunit
MDMAAKEIGMDPIEFRLKNVINPGDLSVGNQVLKSVGIKECVDKAAESIEWKKEKGKYRGKGIALVNHISGLLTVSAIVRLNEDGTIIIQCGAMDIGQGSDTILCQMCAEELGVPMEDVTIHSGDTDGTPYTWATSASRLTFTAGNSVRLATQKVKKKIFELAAKVLEANVDDLEMQDKKVYVKGSPDRALTFHDIGAISCWETGGAIVGEESYFVEEPAFDRTNFTGFPFGTMTAYIFAAQAVEVEVDVETGQVRVLNAVSAHDVGKAIHPANVEGQIEGGFVQGLGFALTEDTIFEKGKILNPTFTDYKIPSAADIPDLKVIIVEANDETGPFGAKGVGEPCLVGVSPAIANAIYDAIGIRFTDLPITPEKVLKALKER